MFRFTSSTINVGFVIIKEYLPKQPNLNKNLVWGRVKELDK